jgi:hypothetical protein
MFHLVGHSLVFSVHACSEAHLILTYEPNVRSRDALELVIGRNGNTLTELRQAQQGVVLKSVSTPDVLDCKSAR